MCRLLHHYHLTFSTPGFYFPSVMSMMSKRVIESERTFTFSVIGAGSHGGTLFVGLFGSAIIRNYGWAFVFYAIGTYHSCYFVIGTVPLDPV